jgi:signal transduction histidine kinase
MKTSLAVRIGLTVIVAFLAISVLAFGFMFRRSDLNAKFALPAPDKVAAIARLLDGLPPESREAVIPALSSPLLEISIIQSSARIDAHPKPGDTPELDEIRARYRAAMPERELKLGTWGEPRRLVQLAGLLRDGHANLDLRVGLLDGDWLVLRSRGQFPMTTFGLPLGFGAGLMGTMIALLMLVFLLRQIRPLEDLARAVDRIDLRDDPKPIPEVRSSAPEIRSVVAAFNRQQERLSRLLTSRLALVGGLQHDVRTFATKVRLRLESANGSGSLDRAIADLDDMVRLLDDALLATLGTEASTDEALELVDIRELLLLEKDARPEQKIALQMTSDGPNDRIYVLGNRLALRRVFSNLIDNAITYGHEARISIVSSLDRIVVTIDDNGPGIPSGMRDMVREPFVRLEQSRARATGGSGLGLAIVSNLVTRHEGRFTISDAPGGGACMIIDLPRFRADRAD